MDDLHRPAAQHVAGPHHQRIADLGGQPDGGFGVRAVRLGGCLRPRSLSSFWKRSRSSAASIMSGEVPMIGTPFLPERARRLSGVCPPNCTITPTGFSIWTISRMSSSVIGSK